MKHLLNLILFTLSVCSAVGQVRLDDLPAATSFTGTDHAIIVQSTVSKKLPLSLIQPYDLDLATIAALTTTSYGRGFLTLADAPAGRTYLGLGTLATQSGTFSGTSSGTNTGDQIVPANTTATASQWFSAYNSATGAFTKTQPSFSNISGSLAASQMPALTGDVTTTAGTVATTLASTTVAPGSYTSANITVDAKGRITTASNGAGGTVTGVTGTAPIVSSGGAAPAISITAATTSAAGSLSAADKTKLDGITGTNTGDQNLSNYVTLDGVQTITGVKTLTTPNIGAATGTSLSLLGTLSSSDLTVSSSGGGVDFINSNGADRSIHNFTSTGGSQFQLRTHGATYIESLFGQSVAGKTLLMASSGDVILGTQSTNNVIFGTNLTERMRLFSSGGLSLGNTTDPGAGNFSSNRAIFPTSGSSSSPTISFTPYTSGIYETNSHLWFRGGSGNFLGLAVSATNNGALYLSSNLDIAIARNAAGVLEITNGTGGVFRDLKLRDAIASGSLTLGTSGMLHGGTNLVEQRNGVNAQTFNLYGTYTDASNYTRGALLASSTGVTLAAQSAGTGSANQNINLTTAGTGTVVANSRLGVGGVTPTTRMLSHGAFTSNSGIWPADNVHRFSTTNGSTTWTTGEIGGYILANAGTTIDYPGGLVFRTKPPGGVDFNSATDRMVIDSNGLVGINMPNPAAMLGIQTTNATTTGLNVTGAASQTAKYIEINSNGGTGGNILSINNLGRVGIGTNNPSAQGMTVVSNTEQLRLGQNSTSDFVTLSVGANSTAKFVPSINSTTAFRFTKGDGSTDVLSIDTTNTTVTTAALVANGRVQANAQPGQNGIAGTPANTDALLVGGADAKYAPLNSPNLVTPNIGAATGTSLQLTGAITAGTSSTVGNGTVDATFGVNGAAGSVKDFRWSSGGVLRWVQRVSGTESGSNSGGDMSFIPRDDTGIGLPTALALRRSDGQATFGGAVVTNSMFTANGRLQANAQPGQNGVSGNPATNDVVLIGEGDSRYYAGNPLNRGRGVIDFPISYGITTLAGSATGTPEAGYFKIQTGTTAGSSALYVGNSAGGFRFGRYNSTGGVNWSRPVWLIYNGFIQLGATGTVRIQLGRARNDNTVGNLVADATNHGGIGFRLNAALGVHLERANSTTHGFGAALATASSSAFYIDLKARSDGAGNVRVWVNGVEGDVQTGGPTSSNSSLYSGVHISVQNGTTAATSQVDINQDQLTIITE